RDGERLLEVPVVVFLVVLGVVEQIDLRVLLPFGIEALAGHIGAYRREQLDTDDGDDELQGDDAAEQGHHGPRPSRRRRSLHDVARGRRSAVDRQAAFLPQPEVIRLPRCVRARILWARLATMCKSGSVARGLRATPNHDKESWRHSMKFTPSHLAAVLAAASFALVGTGADPAQAQAASFTLSSPDLPGNAFPVKFILNGFGCTGANTSPALVWSNVPAGTKSLALQ